KAEVTTSALKVTIRRPPTLAPAPQSPLKGLTIAVNAGHGGRESGASGQGGNFEKNITLAVARKVADELTSAGAKVVLTRNDDIVVPIPRRAEIAMEANADMFVSIHCNSGGDISTSGTAMFYKWPFNHDYAETMRQHIIARTDLPSFGTIGNFNYGPIRLLTYMPGMLVEQAFISNPREEALMSDPEFQKKMALGIREGMEAYLGSVRGDKAEAAAPAPPASTAPQKPAKKKKK
ncbi:MAG: N-acetylmuramoyl-L-alanine amidase, partial [Candidatus Sumerlaeaceae bacterium]|nr:N-acetylmuramoyl-L-alanine amidase [Candidatus Sumerlaeaceae bacterium]